MKNEKLTMLVVAAIIAFLCLVIIYFKLSRDSVSEDLRSEKREKIHKVIEDAEKSLMEVNHQNVKQ